MSQQRRILFVCLGNICRSPLAEGVFAHLVAEAGVQQRYLVDSAGTSGYHSGDAPDERSAAVARRHGITLTSRARRVRTEDFDAFDLLVAMDADNARDLLAICPPAHRAKVRRMREWDPDGDGDVPDPYYGGPRGFDLSYELLLRSCRALLAELEGS